ncbi:hypothetical protein [Gilliamella sp. Imp1-1]|uniref:hypothetical protein n=1 Tax=Gilliamella sp. Imp1-1 TaxID=3120248 RepID=UPI001146D206|nr:hypothetical protein [Gilliamella apicola]
MKCNFKHGGVKKVERRFILAPSHHHSLEIAMYYNHLSRKERYQIFVLLQAKKETAVINGQLNNVQVM